MKNYEKNVNYLKKIAEMCRDMEPVGENSQPGIGIRYFEFNDELIAKIEEFDTGKQKFSVYNKEEPRIVETLRESKEEQNLILSIDFPCGDEEPVCDVELTKDGGFVGLNRGENYESIMIENFDPKMDIFEFLRDKMPGDDAKDLMGNSIKELLERMLALQNLVRETSMKSMTVSELETMIEKNDKTIELNEEEIKKQLIKRIIQQQQTIEEQEKEITDLKGEKNR